MAGTRQPLDDLPKSLGAACQQSNRIALGGQEPSGSFANAR